MFRNSGSPLLLLPIEVADEVQQNHVKPRRVPDSKRDNGGERVAVVTAHDDHTVEISGIAAPGGLLGQVHVGAAEQVALAQKQILWNVREHRFPHFPALIPRFSSVQSGGPGPPSQINAQTALDGQRKMVDKEENADGRVGITAMMVAGRWRSRMSFSKTNCTRTPEG